MEIENAMQGSLCRAVFKNVANGYTIARTYNILPYGEKGIYNTNVKITFNFVIPEVLLKEKREYKMICVSENGIPYVLDDLDNDFKTITFETDKFYAFALIYKDT